MSMFISNGNHNGKEPAFYGSWKKSVKYLMCSLLRSLFSVFALFPLSEMSLIVTISPV